MTNCPVREILKILYKKFNFENKYSPSCVISLKKAGSMGKNTGIPDNNRLKLLNILGIDKLYTLNQQHTTDVFDISELTAGKVYAGDGIITSGKEAIAVTVADCVPIFISDPVNNVYGVVHSGWKGTGIAVAAVNKIKDLYKSNPADIQIIIGPSISSCCYEVDKSRAELFAENWGIENIIKTGEKYIIDLKKANYSALKKEGINSISVSDSCTACSPEYFSYRREGPNDFGLMLALIGYFI